METALVLVLFCVMFGLFAVAAYVLYLVVQSVYRQLRSLQAVEFKMRTLHDGYNSSLAHMESEMEKHLNNTSLLSGELYHKVEAFKKKYFSGLNAWISGWKYSKKASTLQPKPPLVLASTARPRRI